MFNSRPSVVELSRGSTWNPKAWDPPYTLPDDVVGGVWPDGATAQTIFYDTAGGVLATIDGTVSPSGIALGPAAPAVVDLIPNGANFEVFITDADDNPYQIRYGKVIRREAQFLSAPPTDVTQALAFGDSWPTTGLRSAWIRIPPAAALVVQDNSGLSHPNGLGAPPIILGNTYAVMRWYRPLNTDTVKVKVNLLDLHTYLLLGWSRVFVILCGDVNFTSYLAVEFEAAVSGVTHINTIFFDVGTGPTTTSQEGTPVTQTLNGHEFTVGYDDPTNTLSVYKDNDLTPLGSWTDAGHVVPHGPGFRYVGIAASLSQLSGGVQLTSWSAIDAI